MNTEQINLIQKNFELIALQQENFATHFYNQLFALKPTLQLLFPTDLTEQKKKLMMTLGVAIKSLNQPEKLIPILEEMGKRHALYGVRDEHYETVGTALLLMLEETLGSNFTTESKSSWSQMYETVAAAMKSGALALEKESAGENFDDAFNTNNSLNLAGQSAI